MQIRPELNVVTINGNLRRGGYQITGIVDGDTDAVSKGLNLQIEGKSLSSFLDTDWHIAADMHVIANPDFNFDRYSSRTPFQFGTVDNFLSGEHIQDISFAVVASPANSHEATSWNFGEIVTHILQHHTNYIYDATGAAGSPDGVVTSTNIDTTNSTDFTTNGFFYIVNASKNMWSTLQKIGGGEEGGGEFYRIWCTRQNVINYQPAPPFISPQASSKGTLTKSHIKGTVRVTRNNAKPGEQVGQVQLSAVADQNTVYDSIYPANPETDTIFEIKNGMFAHSQARCDTLAQRLYEWLTRTYTIQVQVDPGLILFGDDGTGLDLGDRILMTYDGPTEDTDTGAGVSLNYSSQSMFVYGIDIRYDLRRWAAQAMLTLEEDNSS